MYDTNVYIWKCWIQMNQSVKHIYKFKRCKLLSFNVTLHLPGVFFPQKHSKYNGVYHDMNLVIGNIIHTQ